MPDTVAHHPPLSELYAAHAWRPEELLQQQQVLLRQRDDSAAHKAQLIFALRYAKHKLAKLSTETAAQRNRSWVALGGQSPNAAEVRNKRLQWWVRWWAQRSELQQTQLCLARDRVAAADKRADAAKACADAADKRADAAEQRLRAAKEKLESVENDSWMRQMEAVKKTEARMRVAQQVEMESHVEMVRGEVAGTILTSERLENKLAEAERKAAELARSRSELVSELAELKLVSQHTALCLYISTFSLNCTYALPSDLRSGFKQWY